jgi:16S rRNA (guanine1207-N2)-methyltransferase
MADHYFSSSPQVPSQPSSVTLALPDATVALASDRGVFAADRVDLGTLTLLRQTPPPPPEGNLLDLGCGYGPIACTLARRAPRATVWGVDVNERALALTRANAQALGLANVRAVTTEQIPSDVRFAGLWSNPPIKVGKPVLHDLLSTWLDRLQDDGCAWLVVNKHLGSDSLAAWLVGLGWRVDRMASKSGYRVLRVRR